MAVNHRRANSLIVLCLQACLMGKYLVHTAPPIGLKWSKPMKPRERLLIAFRHGCRSDAHAWLYSGCRFTVSSCLCRITGQPSKESDDSIFLQSLGSQTVLRCDQTTYKEQYCAAFRSKVSYCILNSPQSLDHHRACLGGLICCPLPIRTVNWFLNLRI